MKKIISVLAFLGIMALGSSSYAVSAPYWLCRIFDSNGGWYQSYSYGPKLKAIWNAQDVCERYLSGAACKEAAKDYRCVWHSGLGLYD